MNESQAWKLVETGQSLTKLTRDPLLASATKALMTVIINNQHTPPDEDLEMNEGEMAAVRCIIRCEDARKTLFPLDM